MHLLPTQDHVRCNVFDRDRKDPHVYRSNQFPRLHNQKGALLPIQSGMEQIPTCAQSGEDEVENSRAQNVALVALPDSEWMADLKVGQSGAEIRLPELLVRLKR